MQWAAFHTILTICFRLSSCVTGYVLLKQSLLFGCRLRPNNDMPLTTSPPVSSVFHQSEGVTYCPLRYFRGEYLLFSPVWCPFHPSLFIPVIFRHCRVCILIGLWSNGVLPANTGSQRNLCSLGVGVRLLAPCSPHFSARATVCESIRVCRLLKFGGFWCQMYKQACSDVHPWFPISFSVPLHSLNSFK
jgi:hypothetical protein